MTWRLSVNMMSSGPVSAINSIDIGFGLPLIPRENVTFGPRHDETCRRLLSLCSPFQVGVITSDEWGVTPERGRVRYS